MDAPCRMATTFLGSARGPGSRMRLDLVRGDARNEVAANQAADMAVRCLNDPRYEEFQLQNARAEISDELMALYERHCRDWRSFAPMNWLACISHHPTAAARDTTARTSLRWLAVLNVLSSTPARAKRRAPRPDGPLTHFASPRGEKCRLTH